MADTRYGPDGVPKRPALAGELECGLCMEFREHSEAPWPCCGATGYLHLDPSRGCTEEPRDDCDGCDHCRCEASDYAGACPYFKTVKSRLNKEEKTR